MERVANAEEEGWDGQVKYGWNSSLLKLSPLMVARGGTVVSARRRMCGQDRSVDSVRQTFKANTSRLNQPIVVEA